MGRARTGLSGRDNDDAGEGSSRDLAMGAARPGRVRKCTDLPALLLFVAMLGAMLYVLWLGSKGDAERVLSGMDYMSDLCGHDNRATAPLLVNATFGLPNIFDRLWPFGARAPVTVMPVLRGGRDLRDRPYLYMSMPTGVLDGRGTAALCVSECPGAATGLNKSAGATAPPSQWLCTGQAYTRGAAPAGCDGEADGSAACVAYRASFFARAPPSELARCDDLAQDCEVCYPPYRSIGLLGRYCLPDPRHTLQTFETIAVAFGAVGVAIGGGGTGEPGSGGGGDGDGGGALTVADLERIRSYISSAPHALYEDLAVAWPLVLACIGAAFVFGLAWMLLLRVFAAWMVWGTLLALGASAAWGSWWMWSTQERMHAEHRFRTDERYREQADFLRYGTFGLAGAGGLYLLVVVYLRRRIAIAVRVMREASRAVAALPLMLLLPLATLVCGACLLVSAVYAALLLVSTGELQPGHAGFAHITVPAATWGWLGLLAVGTLWLLWFVKHLQHCTVAGAVSQWYFAEDKWEDVGAFPVLGAMRRALRYHSGSLALGSLLITALMLVRIVVLSVLKRFSACAGDSRLARLACCCVACCLGCVERCVRFLSRTAYVQMMISGGSFCSSAGAALGVLTRNCLKVAVVRSVGAGFLLVGKLFIAAACSAVGAYLLLTQAPYTEELASVGPAVGAIAIGAWLVAIAFMGVYDMTIDAIFLCFVVDHEANGKAGRPTRATASLNALIRDHEGSMKANGEKALPEEVSSTKNPWGEHDGHVGVELQPPRRKPRGARRVDGFV